jgi:hypothetical protein
MPHQVFILALEIAAPILSLFVVVFAVAACRVSAESDEAILRALAEQRSKWPTITGGMDSERMKRAGRGQVQRFHGGNAHQRRIERRAMQRVAEKLATA